MSDRWPGFAEVNRRRGDLDSWLFEESGHLWRCQIGNCVDRSMIRPTNCRMLSKLSFSGYGTVAWLPVPEFQFSTKHVTRAVQLRGMDMIAGAVNKGGACG